MKNRPTSGRTTTARYTAVTIRSTVFRPFTWNGTRGLCVIQQRYNEETKATYWGPIDPWLTDKIYLRSGFKEYFDAHAKKKDSHGYFPTVTVRQLMWALRMKPLKKERWETSFDHVPI